MTYSNPEMSGLRVEPADRVVALEAVDPAEQHLARLVGQLLAELVGERLR